MRPCVLVFAGSDPSGGAGLQADSQAIAAMGAHALTVVTALTVQDNDRVLNVHPVPDGLVQQQALALLGRMDIAAVKIGITGNQANAAAIAGIIEQLRKGRPGLPVVLDPVLASGHGDALSKDSALLAVQSLLPWATLVTPNLMEAAALCGGDRRLETQAERLLRSCPNVLIKGGHGEGDSVVDYWFARDDHASWTNPRLPGAFHGTGCTLASAIAGLLAQGKDMRTAIERGGSYCFQTLCASYAIAPGQRIPNRSITFKESA